MKGSCYRFTIFYTVFFQQFFYVLNTYIIGHCNRYVPSLNEPFLPTFYWLARQCHSTGECMVQSAAFNAFSFQKCIKIDFDKFSSIMRSEHINVLANLFFHMLFKNFEYFQNIAFSRNEIC